MLETPTEMESVGDLKKFLDDLHREMDSIRGQHKDNMRKLADYFLFMATCIDGALMAGDIMRMRKVMETTRDNLRSTAHDVTQENTGGIDHVRILPDSRASAPQSGVVLRMEKEARVLLCDDCFESKKEEFKNRFAHRLQSRQTAKLEYVV